MALPTADDTQLILLLLLMLLLPLLLLLLPLLKLIYSCSKLWQGPQSRPEQHWAQKQRPRRNRQVRFRDP